MNDFEKAKQLHLDLMALIAAGGAGGEAAVALNERIDWLFFKMSDDEQAEFNRWVVGLNAKKPEKPT